MHEDEMLEKIEELVDICSDITVEEDEQENAIDEIANLKEELRVMMERARQVLKLSSLTVLTFDEFYLYDRKHRVLQLLKVKNRFFDGIKFRISAHNLRENHDFACIPLDLAAQDIEKDDFLFSTDLNSLIQELCKRDLIKKTPLEDFNSIEPGMVLYRESVNQVFKTCPNDLCFPTTWEESTGCFHQLIRCIPRANVGVPYEPGFEILDIDFIRKF